MITVDNLSKHYGSVKAVDALSFTVPSGKVTGFLGPNGAGKTTTLRAATGLIRPDSGTAKFGEHTYATLDTPLRRVGVALEPVVFHPGRTGEDHLMMLAPYAKADRKRCREVLSVVGLSDVGGKRVSNYSLGMRGRLNLAAALLGDPEYLLLDEPVNGLDPEGIRWMRELLQALAREGRTILISSHLLSEIEQTVDELVIIAHGALVYQGSLADLDARQTGAVCVETDDPGRVRELALARGWQVSESGQGHHTRTIRITGATPPEIAVAVVGAGLALEGLWTESTGLESIFLSLTEGQGAMR